MTEILFWILMFIYSMFIQTEWDWDAVFPITNHLQQIQH
jgi:hypothetical protein